MFLLKYCAIKVNYSNDNSKIPTQFFAFYILIQTPKIHTVNLFHFIYELIPRNAEEV